MNNPDVATAIAYLIGFLSPLVVDAVKQDTWKTSQVLLLGAIVSFVIYVTLHALLGTLTFPVPPSFIIELVAVFGLQQAGYAGVFKQRNRVVEVPVAPPTVISERTTIVDSAPTVAPTPGNDAVVVGSVESHQP